jgi:hypothetical protein
VDRLVDKALEDKPPPPRFQDSVEVIGQSPDAMLERHFEGLQLECGPTGGGGGAPTETDMRAARPHPSPYADFLPLLKALRGKLKKNQPDRFFLYRVTTPDRTSLLVRAERIPEAMLYTVPGTKYELVRAFPDLDDAVRALRRLERGFDTPLPSGPDLPPQPWATAAPCRP